MANAYWRIRIKGEAEPGDVEAVASELGGTLVRIHFEKGETQLFVATPEAGTRAAGEAKTAYGRAEPVDEATATRLG